MLVVEFEQVEGECLDGEELRLKVPSAAEINKTVTANHMQETRNIGVQSSLCFDSYLGVDLGSKCCAGGFIIESYGSGANLICFAVWLVYCT